MALLFSTVPASPPNVEEGKEEEGVAGVVWVAGVAVKMAEVLAAVLAVTASMVTAIFPNHFETSRESGSKAAEG